MRMKNKLFIFLVSLLTFFVVRITTLSVGNPESVHQQNQEGYYDYQGVIHFHTNYSGDATGTFEEIARVAGQQKVDFLISTDHNTLRPLEDKKEGWYQNTLVLAGEELSLPEGYLLALNVKNVTRLPGEKTEEVISDIVKQGGLLFIAHPDHPKWKWKIGDDRGMTGEEILDFADQWYTAQPAAVILSLLSYPFNSSAAFIQLYERPEKTLKGWDRRNEKNKMVGIFAPDFHQAVRVSGKVKIPFPKAEKVLPIAHDHVLLKNPFSGNFQEDKKALYEAIQKGHLYVSMDILENAGGFLFSAKQNGQNVWMGDQLPAGQPAVFSVKLPVNHKFKELTTRLYRNGREVSNSREAALTFETKEAGEYRVEVEVEIPAFWGGTRKVTWIYSNPIYLR